MGKELRDQGLHIAAGMIAVGPIAIFGPNPLTLAWTTFCVGGSREIGRAGPTVDFASFKRLLTQKLDLSFWALSGFIVGWFV